MKKASILIIASLAMLSSACSITHTTYEPEHDEGFVYEDEKSFAMNVVDGSLNFHYGLRDANVEWESRVAPSGLDYAASGVLGFMWGGVAGGFLGLMSTNANDAPLNYAYGIGYIPVTEQSEIQMQKVIDKVNQDLIDATEKAYDVKFSHFVKQGDEYRQFYSGNTCAEHQKLVPQFYTEFHLKDKQITGNDQCQLSGHEGIRLYRYSTINPEGEKGLFAVVGINRLGVNTRFKTTEQLDKEYYIFQPANKLFGAPFVMTHDKLWFFTVPKKEMPKGGFFPKEQIRTVFPKLETI